MGFGGVLFRRSKNASLSFVPKSVLSSRAKDYGAVAWRSQGYQGIPGDGHVPLGLAMTDGYTFRINIKKMKKIRNLIGRRDDNPRYKWYNLFDWVEEKLYDGRYDVTVA